MTEKIKNIIIKDKKIIIYFMCSGISALLEYILLFVFKKTLFGDDGRIVIANTIAVIISSLLHYIITSKFVFKVKFGIKSFAVYLITFVLGLGIQNAVLWLTYEKLLCLWIKNETLLTLICKTCSLAASFFITYFLRNKLNGWLNKMEGDAKNE